VIDPDAKKARWWDVRRKAWSGFTGLRNPLIDSEAFKALTTAAAVRTLVWFWQEAEYPKVKKRPGDPSPVGRIDKITNNGEISFTYQQAEWRGMNARRFARALKELHSLGFIDVAHLGRGARGDYTKYSLSERWAKYGTTEWQEIPFPENFPQGFRIQPKKINNGRQRPSTTDTNVRYGIAESPDNGHERPLKSAPDSNFQRTPTSVSQDLAMPVEVSEGIQEGDIDRKDETAGIHATHTPLIHNGRQRPRKNTERIGGTDGRTI